MRKEWSRVSLFPLISADFSLVAWGPEFTKRDAVSSFYILLKYMCACIHVYLSTFPKCKSVVFVQGFASLSPLQGMEGGCPWVLGSTDCWELGWCIGFVYSKKDKDKGKVFASVYCSNPLYPFSVSRPNIKCLFVFSCKQHFIMNLKVTASIAIFKLTYKVASFPMAFS